MTESPASHLDVECIGGGGVYVAHGADCVLLCVDADTGWWRNSIAMTPVAARALAARLVQQADATTGSTASQPPEEDQR